MHSHKNTPCEQMPLNRTENILKKSPSQTNKSHRVNEPLVSWMKVTVNANAHAFVPLWSIPWSLRISSPSLRFFSNNLFGLT